MNQEKSSLSIAALVLGIISLVMLVSCCLTFFCFVPAIAGIICALMARSRTEQWEGTAIGGFVCSLISLVAFAVMLCILLLFSYDFTKEYRPGFFPNEYFQEKEDGGSSGDGDVF